MAEVEWLLPLEAVAEEDTVLVEVVVLDIVTGCFEDEGVTLAVFEEDGVIVAALEEEGVPVAARTHGQNRWVVLYFVAPHVG